MPLSSLRSLRWLVAVPLLALLCWFLLPFLIPSRGLDRAWSHLIDAIEDRDDAALKTLLADDYRDGFGFDREQVIGLFDQASRQFIALGIRRERPSINIESSRLANTSAVVRINGNGTPFAHMIVQGSAGVTTPTIFKWRRNSWKPWDWQLTSIENQAVRGEIVRASRQLKQLDGAISNLP